MTKITRTYLSGCKWCNATGIDIHYSGISTTSFPPCPVCNGSKIITVTEVEEVLVEISTIQLMSMHDALKKAEQGARKVFIKATEKYIFNSMSWKQKREQIGLTLRQVADKTGVSPATISRLERGVGNPMMDGITRLKIFYEDYGKNKT